MLLFCEKSPNWFCNNNCFEGVVEGEVTMNGIKYEKNNIIKISPNESTDFKCITDVITVVVKTPSVNNDKFTN